MKLPELLKFPRECHRRHPTFLPDRGYTEVDTPIALLAPPPEVHIDPVATSILSPRGTEQRYLQTSPELPMKRLLSAGSGPIFQIAPVFRDNDESERHRSEFRLLEWYNRPLPWQEMLDETEALLRHCAQELRGEPSLQYGDDIISLSPIPRITCRCFRRYLGVDILAALDVANLTDTFKARGWHFSESDSWDELFTGSGLTSGTEAQCRASGLFPDRVPSPLGSPRPSQRARSKVAERAECIVSGLELSNGFGELHDPMSKECGLKGFQHPRGLGKATPPLDEEFLNAVKGLEGAYGNALGIERP